MQYLLASSFLVVAMLVGAPAFSQTTLEATLTWADVPDETSYRVERSDVGISGPYTAFTDTTAMDVTTYTDTLLQEDFLYCYRVFSVNGTTDALNPSPSICGSFTSIELPPTDVGTIQLQFQQIMNP